MSKPVKIVKLKKTLITKKKPTPVDVNPELKETAIVSFGRMNPPTLGHKVLIDYCNNLAEELKADSKIYLSHSYDSKNPLSYESKLKYCQEAFGSIIVESNHKTLHPILEELKETGYTNIVIVCGSDRTEILKEAIDRINKYTKFKSIYVESCGIRDIDSDNLSESISASSVRHFVQNKDFDSYIKSIPATISEDSSKAMYTELLTELSKHTLKRYITKAASDGGYQGFVKGQVSGDGNRDSRQHEKKRADKKLDNRINGISRAVGKITEAEVSDYQVIPAKTSNGKTTWRKIRKQLHTGNN